MALRRSGGVRLQATFDSGMFSANWRWQNCRLFDARHVVLKPGESGWSGPSNGQITTATIQEADRISTRDQTIVENNVLGGMLYSAGGGAGRGIGLDGWRAALARLLD